jgi:hypothetical protein
MRTYPEFFGSHLPLKEAELVQKNKAKYSLPHAVENKVMGKKAP